MKGGHRKGWVKKWKMWKKGRKWLSERWKVEEEGEGWNTGKVDKSGMG